MCLIVYVVVIHLGLLLSQSYVSACKALPGHAVRFVMRVIKYTQTYTFLYHASVLILLIGHICH